MSKRNWRNETEFNVEVYAPTVDRPTQEPEADEEGC